MSIPFLAPNSRKLFPEISDTLTNCFRRALQCERSSVTVLKYNSDVTVLFQALFNVVKIVRAGSTIRCYLAIPKRKVLYRTAIKREKNKITTRRITCKFEGYRRRIITTTIASDVNLISRPTCNQCFTNALAEARGPLVVSTKCLGSAGCSRETGRCEYNHHERFQHLVFRPQLNTMMIKYQTVVDWLEKYTATNQYSHLRLIEEFPS